MLKHRKGYTLIELVIVLFTGLIVAGVGTLFVLLILFLINKI